MAATPGCRGGGERQNRVLGSKINKRLPFFLLAKIFGKLVAKPLKTGIQVGPTYESRNLSFR